MKPFSGKKFHRIFVEMFRFLGFGDSQSRAELWFDILVSRNLAQEALTQKSSNEVKPCTSESLKKSGIASGQRTTGLSIDPRTGQRRILGSGQGTKIEVLGNENSLK